MEAGTKLARFPITRSVFQIVNGHAFDIHRLGQGRTDIDLHQRHAAPIDHAAFNSGAKIRKVRDQSIDQIAQASVWNALHEGHDVDDLIALECAQAEIIKVKNFQESLPCFSGRLTLDLV